MVSAILCGGTGGGGVAAACYQGLDELMRGLDALALVGRDQFPVALEGHFGYCPVRVVGGSEGGWGGQPWMVGEFLGGLEKVPRTNTCGHVVSSCWCVARVVGGGGYVVGRSGGPPRQ